MDFRISQPPIVNDPPLTGRTIIGHDYPPRRYLVTDSDQLLYLGDDIDQARTVYHRRRSYYRVGYRNRVVMYDLTTIE